jgi:hypothetical protein
MQASAYLCGGHLARVLKRERATLAGGPSRSLTSIRRTRLSSNRRERLTSAVDVLVLDPTSPQVETLQRANLFYRECRVANPGWLVNDRDMVQALRYARVVFALLIWIGTNWSLSAVTFRAKLKGILDLEHVDRDEKTL